MKSTPLLLALSLCTTLAFAQPAAPPQPPPPAPQPPIRQLAPQPPPPSQPASGAYRDPANYVIVVTWTDVKRNTNSIRVLTAEGSFSLETIQSSVRIDENDIPTTVSFNGSITAIDPVKARLKVFLGRTVPYVTGSYSSGGAKASSSYQQLRVGLDSTFTVTFGKKMVVQADQNGEVSILVRREEI